MTAAQKWSLVSIVFAGISLIGTLIVAVIY